MKVANLNAIKAPVAETPSYQPFGKEMRDQLAGLTVREAIAKGLIFDIGDAEGNTVFEHSSADVDNKYAVFNENYAIRCSADLSDEISGYSDNQIMSLRFIQDVSTVPGEGLGKTFWVLGKAAGYKLGAAVKSLTGEVTAG
jgi:hypothetical protein